MKKTPLDELRAAVKERDRELVRLLNERAKLAVEIGRVKAGQNRPVYDPAQEAQVYARLEALNEGPLTGPALRDVFREILSQSRALQTPMTVAYLGPEASFSHLAALSHFGRQARYVPAATIAEVFDAAEKEKNVWGVVPVENSTEGAVKRTLDRLMATPLAIRAERFLRITLCLMAQRSGRRGIRRIYSHPQALAQCQGWLDRNVPRAERLEVASTAAAVRKALAEKDAAAVGSPMAAEAYGLSAVASGIEDSPWNTTRFFVIGRGESDPTGRDKTSILFGTPHVPGTLLKALETLAGEGLNMTRIESYPLRDRRWEYLFFVDFLGHRRDEKVRRCLDAMASRTTLIKILGSYPQGEEA